MERSGWNKGIYWLPSAAPRDCCTEGRTRFLPVALVSLPPRKVAPCDLVMKGCEHTAHCQTNPNTVIEILILLSPSISVSANILHTCGYFEREKAREEDRETRCALWTVRSETEC